MSAGQWTCLKLSLQGCSVAGRCTSSFLSPHPESPGEGDGEGQDHLLYTLDL